MTQILPEYVTQNKDFSITIQLSRPYDLGGERRDKVTLREPTANDQLAFVPADKAPPAELISLERKFFSSLGDGFTAEDIGKLSLRDATRIATAFSFFVD